MKNFTNVLKLTSLSIMAIILVSACELETTSDIDTSGNNGLVQVAGTTSVLTQGLLTYYGIHENTEMHNFDIYIATNGINPQTETGIGDVLFFELLTTTSMFNGGVFSFNNSEDYSENAMIEGRFMKGMNVQTEEMDKLYMVTAGSVSVIKGGTAFDLTFNLTVKEYSTMFYVPIGDPISLTGSYTGSLIYDDASPKDIKVAKF